MVTHAINPVSSLKLLFLLDTFPGRTGKLSYKYLTRLSLFCTTDLRIYVVVIYDTLSDKKIS